MADESKGDANRELIEAIRSFKEESVSAIRSLEREIEYLREATRENNPIEVQSRRREAAERREWELQWFSDHGEWPYGGPPPELPGEESKSAENDAAGRVPARLQVLAAYYLLDALGARAEVHGQKQHVIAMIALITGRNPKTVGNRLADVADATVEDLKFILPLFENLNLKMIADKIKENI